MKFPGAIMSGYALENVWYNETICILKKITISLRRAITIVQLD